MVIHKNMSEESSAKKAILKLFRGILPNGISNDLVSMSVSMEKIPGTSRGKMKEERKQKREEAYIETLKVIEEMKKGIPEKNFAIEPIIEGKFRISIMNAEQIKTGIPLLFGSLNPCCLSLKGTGDGYLRSSIDNTNTSFLVVEELREGQDDFRNFGENPILMEMLCWKSDDVLVLDTIDAVEERKLNGMDVKKPMSFYLSSEVMRTVIEKAGEAILEQNKDIKQVNLGIGGITLICMNATGEYRKKPKNYKKLFRNCKI